MTGMTFKWQTDLLQANPTANATHEAVSFRHTLEQIDDASIHHAEITCIERYIYVRYMAQQHIENSVAGSFEPAFLSTLSDCINNVVSFAPLGDKLRERLRRILQVGIHHCDRAPTRIIEASGDRHLMAEIAREFDDHYTLVGPANLVQAFNALVRASVIDKDNFKIQFKLIEHCDQSFVQGWDILGLIVNWNNHGDLRFGDLLRNSSQIVVSRVFCLGLNLIMIKLLCQSATKSQRSFRIIDGNDFYRRAFRRLLPVRP